jgi:hypothetical protein
MMLCPLLVGFVAGTPKLQQLVLDSISFAAVSSLDPLTQISSLSALTIPHLRPKEKVLQGVSVLANFVALKKLELARWGVTPLQGLMLAQRLEDLRLIKLEVRSFYLDTSYRVSGSLLEVSLSWPDTGS